MIKILISILIVIFGMLIIVISIFSKDKSIRRCDDNSYKSYIKYQTLSDVSSGILFIILGFMSLFNVLSGENVGLISTVLVLINRVVELIISNKYKEIINSLKKE